MIAAIRVTERGQQELSPAQWSLLQGSDSFWRLVDSNVVTAMASPGGGARLRGSSLVGRALCDGVELQFREKVDGALMGLLAVTIPTFKMQAVAAPRTELGETISLLVHAFAQNVRRYVGGGREWEYGSQRVTSSLVGGRLHMPTTLQLRARGLRHLVSFDRSVIIHATDMNRLIYAALREIEVVERLVKISDADLSSVRAMSLFFEDCRDVDVLFGSSESKILLVDTLLTDPLHERFVDLLSLAGVLLSHNSFEASGRVDGHVPLSWFVNLENLFERAVRRRLDEVVDAATDVRSGGRARGIAVFPDSGILFADPDLVVTTPMTCVVGDVKYKDWVGAAAPSDLYQLLVHAASFGADRAFLVFPSDQFEIVDLGRSATRIQTWLFALNVRDLDSGLEAMCSTMGIRTQQAQVTL
jgi:5-methylcytosine-specific restriction endonuclease McrBC regulatory subunit McrC